MSESHLSKIKIRGTGREVTYKLNDDEARAYISALEQRVLALENIIGQIDVDFIQLLRTANTAIQLFDTKMMNLEKRIIQKLLPNGLVVWTHVSADSAPFDYGIWETTDELANYVKPWLKDEDGDSQTEVITHDPAT